MSGKHHPGPRPGRMAEPKEQTELTASKASSVVSADTLYTLKWVLSKR